jgi:hypothetical protein
MGGFAKRYDTRKNMLALVDYVWKKSMVIQCYVTPAILKTMKTRKFTWKPRRKNYKTKYHDNKPDQKKNVNFFDSYKNTCINAAKSRLRKNKQDKPMI